MRRLIAFLLVFTAVFLTAATASAVDGTAETIVKGNWEYKPINTKEASVVRYLGSAKSVTVPKYIDGRVVSELSAASFYNSKLEKIIMPEELKKIGSWAFYGCKSLKTVSLNNGLNEIERGVFMNCPSLSGVFIPSTVRKIGADSFAVSCATKTDVKDFSGKEKVSLQSYKTQYGFTISGYSGTSAEKYAGDMMLNFKSVGQINFGDIDLNRAIDSADVQLLNDYMGGARSLSHIQLLSADINGNAIVDSNDVSLIQDCADNNITAQQLPCVSELYEDNNYLSGMSMYCDGDSVAKGTGTNILGKDFYSFCNYVSEKGNMQMNNCAVPGTTLARRENFDNSILERIYKMNAPYDVILLDGGFNDLFKSVPLGKMTSSTDFSGIYDEYTTAGALESICYFLNTNYNSSIKLFVLCHKMQNFPNQSEYWETIKQILNKWSIAYVDISQETDFTNINPEITTQYFKYKESIKSGDGIHPNEYSAKSVYGPIVYKKLNYVAKKSTEMDFPEKQVEIAALEKFSQLPNFTDGKLSFSSDDTEVAEVDDNGGIKPKSLGKTTIRACSEEGISVQYSLTVNFLAMDLHFNKNKLVLRRGYQKLLTTHSMPGTTACCKKFSSADESVATVDENGLITAVGKGKTRIICSSLFGVTAVCTVRVK